MATKKQKVLSLVRVDAHAVFARAVEEGIKYGLNRAHKHTDKPSRELLEQELFNAVTNEVSEFFQWGEE